MILMVLTTRSFFVCGMPERLAPMILLMFMGMGRLAVTMNAKPTILTGIKAMNTQKTLGFKKNLFGNLPGKRANILTEKIQRGREFGTIRVMVFKCSIWRVLTIVRNTQTELRVLDNFTDAGSLPPDGSHVYMTDIYVDDTYARVMIGDAPTLAASKHREIQIPQSWTDNGSSAQISIVVHQGTFANNASAYLFVVDGKSNISSGKQITFGTSQ